MAPPMVWSRNHEKAGRVQPERCFQYLYSAVQGRHGTGITLDTRGVAGVLYSHW
jgi:hypothetical protein